VLIRDVLLGEAAVRLQLCFHFSRLVPGFLPPFGRKLLGMVFGVGIPKVVGLLLHGFFVQHAYTYGSPGVGMGKNLRGWLLEDLLSSCFILYLLIYLYLVYIFMYFFSLF